MGLGVPMEMENGKVISVNPSRDIAHFWPQLVMTIRDGLFAQVWEDWFKWFCQLNKVSEDDLLKAHACYFEFMRLALVPDIKHPFDALRESGFFDCPPAAQLVVVAKLGQIATGAFWAGARDAYRLNSIPDSVISLADTAKTIKDGLAASWSQAYSIAKDKQE